MSRFCRRLGGVGVVAAIGAAASVSLAGAAHGAPLPNGSKTIPAPPGWSIRVTSTNNSVVVQPSLATAQTRSALVSSTASVDVQAPAGTKDIDGKLGIGVIVGCQLPGPIGVGISVSGPSAGASTEGLSASLGGVTPSLSVPLAPGATDSVSGYKRADTLGALEETGFGKSGTFDVGIQGQNIDIRHCGYAQARLVTWVQLKGGNRLHGVLYGAPFSLG